MDYIKKMFNSIPSRLKAIYLLWFTIHLFLLLTSGNFLSTSPFSIYNDKESFYPFNGFDKSCYDISEFIIYLFLPIAIYYIYKLWKGK